MTQDQTPSFLTSALLSLFFVMQLNAQNDDLNNAKKWSGFVTLDSIIVLAERYNFDTEDFMSFVLEDNSLQQAFRRMRKQSYRADLSMTFYRKNGNQRASQHVSFSQYYPDSCARFEISDRKVEGDLFKTNGDYRYLTAELFDHLFFRPGPCRKNNFEDAKTKRNPEKQSEPMVQKRADQLRHIIFEPGKQSDIPFLGNKLDIFSLEMQPFYNYYIMYDTLDRLDTYLFKAVIKPDFREHKEGKTVLTSLKTWFHTKDRQVLRRIYTLDYNPWFISCKANIRMDIQAVNGKYLPVYLSYNGAWNIPFKRREIGAFEVHIQYD